MPANARFHLHLLCTCYCCFWVNWWMNSHWMNAIAHKLAPTWHPPWSTVNSRALQMSPSIMLACQYTCSLSLSLFFSLPVSSYVGIGIQGLANVSHHSATEGHPQPLYWVFQAPSLHFNHILCLCFLQWDVHSGMDQIVYASVPLTPPVSTWILRRI